VPSTPKEGCAKRGTELRQNHSHDLFLYETTYGRHTLYDRVRCRRRSEYVAGTRGRLILEFKLDKDGHRYRHRLFHRSAADVRRQSGLLPLHHHSEQQRSDRLFQFSERKHPDFSSGSLLQFGFVDSNTNNGIRTTLSGADNFTVTLNGAPAATPEPGAVAILMGGGSTALLMRKHGKRRRG
jgi:hypothetical protein